MSVVRKCKPQSDNVERSDVAKRLFIAGWEREREREREA
jgi:Ni,Fe-hydrogenase III component G